ncbi:hypothetical protein EV06_0309 [Prochlorococcus sp. MIT 0602]|nr:hypothetical protein EV06_0309 [Prochlorococcus sp. MIT 0602]KGG17054.1 hypothetical protein EV07_0484 [Prochlorococcus sp. MIT 0603]
MILIKKAIMRIIIISRFNEFFLSSSKLVKAINPTNPILRNAKDCFKEAIKNFSLRNILNFIDTF